LQVKSTVCFVHYTSAPGGIELLMPDIISSLDGERRSVFVIRPPVAGKFNVYDGVPVSVTYGSANNLVAAYRLWRHARRNRGAVFHGFNTGPFFLLVLRLAGVRKAVYSIHGTRHFSNSMEWFTRRFVWRLALSPQYTVISNSEHSKAVFLDFIKPLSPAVRVLYNPVSAPRLGDVRRRSSGGGLNIIYIGRLVEGKNLSGWLEMARAIRTLRSDARFLVYGDGPLKESLIREGEEKGMKDYLFFRGFTADLSSAFSDADLMMFLSEYESFGNVVVESILYGVPVIAAGIPSVREIFRDFPGFLVSAGPAMESEILERISRLDELRQMVPEASSQFRERFSLEQHTRGLREVYGSLRSVSPSAPDA
jgi:glycosyltransferase involved in cell wall biosynthesis